jgi:hypothetical protein
MNSESSIKGAWITTIIFGGEDTSVEVYEYVADAEARVKEWILEIAKDSGNERFVSLIEEKGIYDADVIQALSDEGHWFQLDGQNIG